MGNALNGEVVFCSHQHSEFNVQLLLNEIFHTDLPPSPSPFYSFKNDRFLVNDRFIVKQLWILYMKYHQCKCTKPSNKWNSNTSPFPPPLTIRFPSTYTNNTPHLPLRYKCLPVFHHLQHKTFFHTSYNCIHLPQSVLVQIKMSWRRSVLFTYT